MGFNGVFNDQVYVSFKDKIFDSVVFPKYIQ